MPKNSFVVYHNYRETLEDLTDEQVGQLFRAIFNYAIDGKEPDFKGILSMAFKFIKKDLDVNLVKYENICKRNRENGQRGGAPKGNQNARKQPKQPKQPDNDNVVDNEDDNDNDKVVDVNIQNSTTTKLKTLQSLCESLTLDVQPDSKYDLDLLIEKVKESRFLKKFNLLSEMLKKYDLIILGRYKDYYEDKPKSNKKPKEREYSKEQLNSLFLDINDIEI